jgi:hypothetical protein
MRRRMTQESRRRTGWFPALTVVIALPSACAGASAPETPSVAILDAATADAPAGCGRPGVEVRLPPPNECNVKICGPDGQWGYTLVGCGPPKNLLDGGLLLRNSDADADLGFHFCDASNLKPGCFDRRGFGDAIRRAQVRLDACARPSVLGEAGHISITLESSGVSSKARVDAPPFENSIVAPCIEKVFTGIRLAPFSNGPITFGASFQVHAVPLDASVDAAR